MMERQDKALKHRISFDGRFTDQVRRLLRRKRVELGLPYHRAARFLGVNWSTFRKWELGPTENCELYYRAKLESFINGDYDNQLLELYHRRHTRSYSELLPNPISECMERVTNAYRLCRQRPELREGLLEKVDCAALAALQKLISMAPDELAGQFLADELEDVAATSKQEQVAKTRGKERKTPLFAGQFR
ncbi:MAG: hypothetical protein GX574_11265 [Lentisphaerae bacterium]|nr:hypothetical protein [Lentisphaerota bacterium]